MRLRILSPTKVEVDANVRKVTAEAVDGSFCLLPRHADFVAGLAQGVLIYVAEPEGYEAFLAVNGGTLVKCGDDVLVSTPEVVFGESLDALHDAVTRKFQVLDKQEQRAELALNKIEADFVRRFVELQEHGG